MGHEDIINILSEDSKKQSLALKFMYSYHKKITDDRTGESAVIEVKFYYDLLHNRNGYYPIYFTVMKNNSDREIYKTAGQYYNPSDSPETSEDHRKNIEAFNSKLKLN